MAADEPPAVTVLPELVAFPEAKVIVNNKNLACAEVAGKMFVLYKNLLSKNTRHKWTTIVESQVEAETWTDLRGTIQTVAQSPSYQSFEYFVTFHLLTVFPLDAAEQESYYVNVHIKSLLVK